MAINSSLNEPPTRGQPPKRGQKLCSQSLLYSEVALYIENPRCQLGKISARDCVQPPLVGVLHYNDLL